MANSDSTSPTREVRIARHIRTTLQHRHRNSPRFLEILFKLSDEQLLKLEREHHAATVAAIQAAKSRVESAQKIADARIAQTEVEARFELLVTDAMRQASRRNTARRGKR
jgi:phosphatidylserine/phosphatidylglycerophosphate/cardiolipin synthase-like enzyme